ncbi:MAG: hypothetical protein LAP21_15235 [Acidobacteriia bacterium]|nr:hypothetical protein [Terriglobia bacterium]
MQSSIPDNGNSAITIPADRIVSELCKSAQPGYYGQKKIRISLRPACLQGVVFLVSAQRKVRSSDPLGEEEVPAAGETSERELLVRGLVAKISGRLQLRCSIVEVTAHYADGKLQGFDLVDEHQETVKV